MDPKVHFRVHNVMPLVLIRNKMIPIHAPRSYFFKFDFITILASASGSSYCSLSSGLPTKTLYASIFHACYMSCLSHPSWFGQSNNICRDKNFEAPIIAFTFFLLVLSHSVKIFSSAPGSHTPTVYTSDFFFWTLSITLPVTVAARPKTWNVSAPSNTGIVGSNPTQGLDVCVRLFCLCCSVCR
jgi:hypothetical protein